MKVSVKVVPGAKIETIQTALDGSIKVWVKGKPVEGEANKTLINLLAKYYKTTKSKVRIVAGLKSRNKVVEIID